MLRLLSTYWAHLRPALLVYIVLVWPTISLSHPSSLDFERASAVVAADPPRQSNGFTDVVQWDNYTLFLHDQRLLLQYVPYARNRDLCFTNAK